MSATAVSGKKKRRNIDDPSPSPSPSPAPSFSSSLSSSSLSSLPPPSITSSSQGSLDGEVKKEPKITREACMICHYYMISLKYFFK